MTERAKRTKAAPTFAAEPHLERLLWRLGVTRVAGVDEAGMGPLAGPVVAAAVVFRQGEWVPGVADSKVLRPAQRETLAAEIRQIALAVGIGVAEVEEIDRVNIYQAGLLALRRAVEALAPVVPEWVLVDARDIPGLTVPQSAYIKGDAFVCSVAAASIVAKVHRDHLMRALDAEHPGYGFAQHMGYGTPSHLQALRAQGPSAVHRRSFAPVAALLPGAPVQLTLG